MCSSAKYSQYRSWFKATDYCSLLINSPVLHKHRRSVFTQLSWEYVPSAPAKSCIFFCFMDAHHAHTPGSDANSLQFGNMATYWMLHKSWVFPYLSLVFFTELTDLQSTNHLTSSNCLAVCLYCTCNMNSPLISLPFPSHFLSSCLYVSFYVPLYIGGKLFTFLINFAKIRNVFGFLINRGWGLSILEK